MSSGERMKCDKCGRTLPSWAFGWPGMKCKRWFCRGEYFRRQETQPTDTGDA